MLGGIGAGVIRAPRRIRHDGHIVGASDRCIVGEGDRHIAIGQQRRAQAHYAAHIGGAAGNIDDRIGPERNAACTARLHVFVAIRGVERAIRRTDRADLHDATELPRHAAGSEQTAVDGDAIATIQLDFTGGVAGDVDRAFDIHHAGIGVDGTAAAIGGQVYILRHQALAGGEQQVAGTAGDGDAAGGARAAR